ncbi:MAG: Tripartite DNA replication factor [Piccolia ochrophora]|nr:MAG: Tripartite DNA replication factor [Piccolia ochrophora]
MSTSHHTTLGPWNDANASHWKGRYRRGSWRKTTSNVNASLGSTTCPNRPTAPPIAIAAKTKAKLHAFRFVPSTKSLNTFDDAPVVAQPMEEHQDDDQNVASEGAEMGAVPASQDIRVTDEGFVKPVKAVPQTPATRLPLAVLIGNNEDSSNKGVGLQLTPDERVYWKHNRSPNSDISSPQATPSAPIPRGKKRARSSSPSSSPNGPSHHLSANDAYFNHQPVQRSTKTPQADPAVDLWNRYSVDAPNSDKAHIDFESMPAFAHLFDGSSPRIDQKRPALFAVTGLRRSVSCGIEWPTSKAKRRRTSGPELRAVGNDIINLKESGRAVDQSESKLSRVSLLVEKVQESLAQSTGKPPAQGQSSSLPLPDPNGCLVEMVRLSVEEQRALDGIDTVGADEQHGEMYPAPPPEGKAGESSSDFGDFDDRDVDISVLNMADHEDKARHDLGLATDAPLEHDEKLDEGCAEAATTTSPATACLLKRTSPRSVQKKLEEEVELDEFGEDDNGLFAADLEDVLVEYEAQVNSTTADGPELKAATPNLVRPTKVTTKSDNMIPRPTPPADVVSEDEYGSMEDIDFHLVAAENIAVGDALEKSNSQSINDVHARAIKRYLITSVAEGFYSLHNGEHRPEKVLLIKEEKTSLSKAVTLRQAWFDTPCTLGAYVHVIGEFTREGQCIIDNDNNMLILHPDHLISSTVVADSFGCTRRAVLQDRVKATNEASPPQVYGHILHEIFQEAMRANRWDNAWLQDVIEQIVMRYVEDIAAINLEVHQAVAHLMSKMPQLQAWAEVFVQAKPQAEAIVDTGKSGQCQMSINKLLDVEEHVWSPMYGLKGNIDATVQVTVDDVDGERTLTVPLEVKTGRNTTNASHRAQTALYTLLLSDRYDVEIAYGILYYLETSNVIRIPANRHELLQMIMQRNELACYVRDRLELPGMLKNPHTCSRCYAKVPCFIYHKLMDDGNGETSGLHDKFEEVVRHLKPQDQMFFKRWDDLITKEETEMLRFRRELWTMISADREKLGRCFANVIIEAGSAQEDQDAPKINRYRYTLLKQHPGAGFSFVESQITVGEPIVISDEEGHFALANGYVTHVRKRRITVAVDRRLHNARTRRKGFHAKTNQVFAGIMEVREDGAPPSTLTQTESEEPVCYRLDKDEFGNGMATVRNNLIQAMNKGDFGSQTIRRLVVECQPPRFRIMSSPHEITKNASLADLNDDQKGAITKVMAAEDYALVLGMPGTGKTTTIAHIIRALVSQRKSILLASYTHTAVDNILLKIASESVAILRLGAIAKVHPDVKKVATLAAEPKKSVEDLHASYHTPQVVATTCLGINHQIFRERVFDYCIVDEASQITLPVCLGPIRMAKKFILVGDHNQLPPLVQNAEAREGGLDVSLFKLLSEKHPDSVVRLEHQYRMCEDIMMLSNTLIYDGHLKCGTASVAQQELSIPNMEGLAGHHSSSTVGDGSFTACLQATRGTCWLRDLLDPSRKACFVNHDPLLPASREQARGSRIVNHAEARLTAQLVDALLSTGVPVSSIGVISVYRSQISLLKQHLRHHPGLEMHTADKFQGRDKDVIILSLVRSNDARNVGDLLKDWRRVNVAFTRARTKLLVLGSKSTLKENELLGRFIDLMVGRSWVFDMPPGALDMHRFEETATQATGKGSGRQPQSATSSQMLKGVPDSSSRMLKENVQPWPRTAEKVGRVSERAVLGSRPVLRDIVNDLS